MKNLILLLPIIFFVSCLDTKKQKSEGGAFTVEINIKGLDSGFAQLYLNERKIIEPIPFKNGIAVLQGKVGFPTLAMIAILKNTANYIDSADRPYVMVYLEKGTITVTGNKSAVYSSLSDELSVSGTPLNMEENEYRKKLALKILAALHDLNLDDSIPYQPSDTTFAQFVKKPDNQ